jgi:hypothetical protein
MANDYDDRRNVWASFKEQPPHNESLLTSLSRLGHSKCLPGSLQVRLVQVGQDFVGPTYEPLITQLGHPGPGGYEYGNLALQVGRVPDETVKYGYKFCATRTIQLLHCKLQTRPLVKEGAPQKQGDKFQTGSNIWSQVPEWARYQDILAD